MHDQNVNGIVQGLLLPGLSCLLRNAVVFPSVKVMLYSYLILKKMNERITTNIHNERIKTKYIPSYIFENEGKIFKI